MQNLHGVYIGGRKPGQLVQPRKQEQPVQPESTVGREEEERDEEEEEQEDEEDEIEEAEEFGMRGISEQVMEDLV